MNFKQEINDRVERLTTDLAKYDSAMRAMDYPGLSDDVWRELAAISQLVYDDGVDPERFRELDFREYVYTPEDEFDEDRNGDEIDET